MNPIRKALASVLGWVLYSPKRAKVVVIALCVGLFAWPIGFQGSYALWYNTQVLPGLRAEYDAEQAEQARIAALPKRHLPLPVSMREGVEPASPGITVYDPADLSSVIPDAPAGNVIPQTDGAIQSSPAEIPLIPSAAGDDDAATTDAVEDAADAFATAYLDGDQDTAADLSTPVAQSMLTAEGSEGRSLGGLGASVTRVDLLEGEATANVDVGDGMGLLLLTLRQEGDQWLVHSYHMSVPQGR